MWWILWMSCARPGGVEALRACADLPCQEAALDAAVDADPAAVRAWLPQVADPLAQVALVSRLGGRDPALLAGLCPQLSPPASLRCERFASRPHLRQGGRGPTPQPRAAPGPGPAGLFLSPSLAPVLPATAARPDCGARCREVARGAARDGDAVQADLGCAALADPRESSECRFEAAEAAVAQLGAAGLATALPLCAASTFSGSCLDHVTVLAAPPAVPADRVDPQAVAQARRVAATLAAAAGPQAALATDYFWATWVGSAFAGQRQVHGDLAALLPAQALPHLRFEAARVLLAQAGPTTDLDAMADALLAALDPAGAHPGGPGAGPRLPVVVARVPRPAWLRDLPGEDTIPSVFALGTARRPTDLDPAVDARLALLAAMALDPSLPVVPGLSALLGDPDRPELLRWAVALTLSLREPAALQAWAATRTDPSPRVQRRLLRAPLPPHPAQRVPSASQ